MSSTTRNLYMEARDENGKLLLGNHPQPPFSVCSENEIANYYFQHSGDMSRSANLNTIYGWFNERNWRVRAKTW